MIQREIQCESEIRLKYRHFLKWLKLKDLYKSFIYKYFRKIRVIHYSLYFQRS